MQTAVLACLGETHMDPLASVGLIVVLIAAIAAGYYIMRPEKPQKN
jgi:hypothetical protein